MENYYLQGLRFVQETEAAIKNSDTDVKLPEHISSFMAFHYTNWWRFNHRLRKQHFQTIPYHIVRCLEIIISVWNYLSNVCESYISINSSYPWTRTDSVYIGGGE